MIRYSGEKAAFEEVFESIRISTFIPRYFVMSSYMTNEDGYRCSEL